MEKKSVYPNEAFQKKHFYSNSLIGLGGFILLSLCIPAAFYDDVKDIPPTIFLLWFFIVLLSVCVFSALSNQYIKYSEMTKLYMLFHD